MTSKGEIRSTPYLNMRQLVRMRAARGLEELGRVEDAVIDHVVWTVQQLVVRCGPFWRRRRYLVPREAMLGVVWSTWISVRLRRKELARPEALARKIDGRWVAGLAWEHEAAAAAAKARRPTAGVISPDLYSGRELLGYPVEAENGRVGYLDDLVCDETRWLCVGLVVREGRFSRKRLLVPVQWVRTVDHGKGIIHCVPDRDIREDAARVPGADNVTEADIDRLVTGRSELRYDHAGSRRR